MATGSGAAASVAVAMPARRFSQRGTFQGVCSASDCQETEQKLHRHPRIHQAEDSDTPPIGLCPSHLHAVQQARDVFVADASQKYCGLCATNLADLDEDEFFHCANKDCLQSDFCEYCKEDVAATFDEEVVALCLTCQRRNGHEASQEATAITVSGPILCVCCFCFFHHA